jgi:BirA family biotin operon repressor/biotin-[acetyl-CoA-carboxylase] ligase
MNPNSPCDQNPTMDDPLELGPLRERLNTSILGRHIQMLDVCESTNIVARKMLETPRTPLNGSLIVTNYQHAGYGRQGARWASPPGHGLLFSLILYPAQSPQEKVHTPSSTQLVTMALALGILKALHDQGTAPCTIKWPNDILDARRRKICGILTESVPRPDGTGPGLIAGAGINVHQRPEDFPPQCRESSVSANMLSSRSVRRCALLKSILERTEEWLEKDCEALFSGWRERCSTIGHVVRVVLHQGYTPLRGMAMGLANDGGLRLRLQSGSIRTVRAGEVEEIRAE